MPVEWLSWRAMEAVEARLIGSGQKDVCPRPNKIRLGFQKDLRRNQKQMRRPQGCRTARESDIVLIFEGRAETAIEDKDWSLEEVLRHAGVSWL